MTKATVVEYLLELAPLVAAVGLVALVPLSKLVIGAVLTLAGAFLPRQLGATRANEPQGNATFSNGPLKLAFKGGLRFAVIVGGIVLLVFGGAGVPVVVDDAQAKISDASLEQAKKYPWGLGALSKQDDSLDALLSRRTLCAANEKKLQRAMAVAGGHLEPFPSSDPAAGQTR